MGSSFFRKSPESFAWGLIFAETFSTVSEERRGVREEREGRNIVHQRSWNGVTQYLYRHHNKAHSLSFIMSPHNTPNTILAFLFSEYFWMMIDEDIFSKAVSRRNDYRIVFTILSCLSPHIILYFTLC